MSATSYTTTPTKLRPAPEGTGMEIGATAVVTLCPRTSQALRQATRTASHFWMAMSARLVPVR